MEHYRKRPCRGCHRKPCGKEECSRWQAWFLDSWAAVNGYAWQQRDELGREEPNYFTYQLAHENVSPCDSCRCASWCDTPCSFRLRWWDQRMARLRKMQNAEGSYDRKAGTVY